MFSLSTLLCWTNSSQSVMRLSSLRAANLSASRIFCHKLKICNSANKKSWLASANGKAGLTTMPRAHWPMGRVSFQPLCPVPPSCQLDQCSRLTSGHSCAISVEFPWFPKPLFASCCHSPLLCSRLSSSSHVWPAIQMQMTSSARGLVLCNANYSCVVTEAGQPHQYTPGLYRWA